ncbi:hypothetical protein CL6EHI_110820 [Entamoeba histolytica]|uniref:Chaperone DnaJ C-terminal domain-containing protein n=2 Tax=Entamoeba histolytica TaxID=5759 RepID=C4LUC8_ENTH1|nr:hypothetical protein EHI_110820 [Entamoeba histolytica HM-1:IMSS]EAL48895.1 hypothetical protein EHI_110820 [Entamoeba histolytica HM-1:IMSS]GAT92211.1 hypothetical protein CL6EHI_110820 [Entamoeba histolytica]|eukprot:XP_654281.1 hypothetical protein EHI_110820 [Entamoeba histolytica HM-1:IMSS]
MQNTNNFHVLKESLNALCKIVGLFNQTKKETEEANTRKFNEHVTIVNQCIQQVFQCYGDIPDTQSPNEMSNTLDYISLFLLTCVTTLIGESTKFLKNVENLFKEGQSDEEIVQKMQELYQKTQGIMLINGVGPSITSIYNNIMTAKGDELRSECQKLLTLLTELDKSNITTVTLQFGEDIIDLPLQILETKQTEKSLNNADQKMVQRDEGSAQMNYGESQKQRTLLEIREEYQKIKSKNSQMKKDLEKIKQSNKKIVQDINERLLIMKEMQKKENDIQQIITQLKMKSLKDEKTIDELRKENQRLKSYIEQMPMNQMSQETFTHELKQETINKKENRVDEDIPIEPQIVTVDIPIYHYFTGCQEEIEINKQIFTIPISVGLSDGAEFNYKGYGTPINGRKRDLIIVTKTQQTESFRRQENNLFQTVVIPQSYRNKTFQCSIPCIDGNNIPVIITGQEGIQGPYERYGMPIGTTGKRGDLYLIIKLN